MPDPEGPRQIAAATGGAVEQRDPASLGGKTVDQARAAPPAPMSATRAPRSVIRRRSGKKSRLHVGVVPLEAVPHLHDRVDRPDAPRGLVQRVEVRQNRLLVGSVTLKPARRSSLRRGRNSASVLASNGR